MPKRIKPLTETKIRTEKKQEKEYKIFDGGGLFLLVTPMGGKLWRLKYRFEGNRGRNRVTSMISFVNGKTEISLGLPD
jgi:hypothetical protein